MNLEGRFAGQTDTPLTDLGREQARQAGLQAQSLSIDTIVTSTLSRAQETAGIIAEAIGYPTNQILVNKLLVERDYGELEGKPWSFPTQNIEQYKDVESTAALQERVAAGLDYLRSLKGHTVLLVGHGTFLIVLQALLNPASTTTEAELLNAQIVQLM